MRRAQSVRNHTNGRPSLQLGVDDLGALAEGDERSEDGLRKKLLEKDRENDRVCASFGFLGVFGLRRVLCSCAHRFRHCKFSSPSDRLRKPFKNYRKSTRIWSCSCKVLNERTKDAWESSSGETGHLVKDGRVNNGR